MDENKFFREMTKHEKSQRQEKAVAKFTKGKKTIASGAVFRDGDVAVGRFKIRIEAKRTDGVTLQIEKGWMKKIKGQSRFQIPVLHIQIQDEEWYVIRPAEMALILEYLEAIQDR